MKIDPNKAKTAAKKAWLERNSYCFKTTIDTMPTKRKKEKKNTDSIVCCFKNSDTKISGNSFIQFKE